MHRYRDAYFAARAIDDVEVVLPAVGALIQTSGEVREDHEAADAVGDDGLERWALDGRSLGEAIPGTGAVVPTFTGTAAATWRERLWFADLGTFRELPLDEGALPFAGRRTIGVGRHRGVAIVRPGVATWSLPVGAQLIAAAALFDGASVALIVQQGETRVAWISTSNGSIHQRIEIPPGELRIASRRGVAVLRDGERLTVIDLRFGRVLKVGDLATIPSELAVDGDGMHLALRDSAGVRIVALAEALRPRQSVDSVVVEATPSVRGADAPVVVDAPVAVTEPTVHRAVIVRPLALPALAPRAATHEIPRDRALGQLDVELRLVAAWTYGAIAHDWDSRRLDYANESAHPHEHEVAAILGKNGGFATELVAASHDEIAAEEITAGSVDHRRGPGTALGARAAELGLTPLAVDILLVVAAPAVWGDLAPLYGILANDSGRPLVDELLVQHVLAARANRHDIARELDPRAPLVRAGLIEVGPRARPFAQLSIDPVVIARLRAEPADLGAAVTVRTTGSCPVMASMQELFDEDSSPQWRCLQQLPFDPRGAIRQRMVRAQRKPTCENRCVAS